MRFLPLAFVVGGALAAVQADQGEEQTVTVTEYTTYCPSATMSQAPQFTTSAGQTFSISRPLITTTVTHCEKCSSSTTPAPSVIPVEVPSSNPSPTPSSSSIVLGPSSVDAVSASSRAWASASASASGSGSPSGPSSPLFTGAASRAAASAGVGLSAVLGAVAFLL